MSFDATGVITNADGSYAKLLDTISAASIHVCTGTKFTYLTNNVVTFQSDNCLVLFSVGERTHSLIKFENGQTLDAYAVCPATEQVVAAVRDNNGVHLQFYSLDTHQTGPITVITDPETVFPILHLAVSPNGAKVVSVSSLVERQIKFWDVQTRALLISRDIKTTEIDYNSISFHPHDENQFCTIQDDCITFWRFVLKFNEEAHLHFAGTFINTTAMKNRQQLAFSTPFANQGKEVTKDVIAHANLGLPQSLFDVLVSNETEPVDHTHSHYDPFVPLATSTKKASATRYRTPSTPSKPRPTAGDTVNADVLAAASQGNKQRTTRSRSLFRSTTSSRLGGKKQSNLRQTGGRAHRRSMISSGKRARSEAKNEAAKPSAHLLERDAKRKITSQCWTDTGDVMCTTQYGEILWASVSGPHVTLRVFDTEVGLKLTDVALHDDTLVVITAADPLHTSKFAGSILWLDSDTMTVAKSKKIVQTGGLLTLNFSPNKQNFLLYDDAGQVHISTFELLETAMAPLSSDDEFQQQLQQQDGVQQPTPTSTMQISDEFNTFVLASFPNTLTPKNRFDAKTGEPITDSFLIYNTNCTPENMKSFTGVSGSDVLVVAFENGDIVTRGLLDGVELATFNVSQLRVKGDSNNKNAITTTATVIAKVTSLTISADGAVVVTGHSNGLVRVFDYSDDANLRLVFSEYVFELEAAESVSSGILPAIRTVKFSPDNNYLAVSMTLPNGAARLCFLNPSNNYLLLGYLSIPAHFCVTSMEFLFLNGQQRLLLCTNSTIMLACTLPEVTEENVLDKFADVDLDPKTFAVSVKKIASFHFIVAEPVVALCHTGYTSDNELVVLTRDKRMLNVTLDFTNFNKLQSAAATSPGLPAVPAETQAFLPKAIMTRVGHKKECVTGHLVVSPDGTLIASGGPDGRIVVFSVTPKHVFSMHSGASKNIPVLTTIAAHKPANGGVNGLAFSEDSRYIVSSGNDGGVFTWDMIKIKREAKELNQAAEITVAQDEENNNVTETEGKLIVTRLDQAVSDMSSLRADAEAPPKTNTTSTASAGARESKYADKKAESATGGISDTPASEGNNLLSGFNESEEDSYFNKLSAQVSPTKRRLTFLAKSKGALKSDTHTGVHDVTQTFNEIKQKLQVLMARNETCDPMEKLERLAFVVDVETQEALIESGNARAEDTRQAITESNQGKELICHRIKSQCWDSLAVPGSSIRGLMSDIVVHNFPIRVKTKAEQLRTRKVLFMRRLNVLEEEWIYDNILPEHEQVQEVEQQETEFEDTEELYAETKKKPFKLDSNSINPLMTGDPTRHLQYMLFTQCGVPRSKQALNASGNLSNVVAQDEKTKLPGFEPTLPYHPLALTSHIRRRVQCYIIAAHVEAFQREYNKHFNMALEKKHELVDTIHVMNTRINEIQADMKITAALFEPKMAVGEMPESILVVEDSEITAERHLSAEQLASLEVKNIKGPEDIDREKADKRALHQMMWGTIQNKKDLNTLAEELIRPEWMDTVAEDEMTEEQKEDYDAFVLKEKLLISERESLVKALDTELKKLKSDVNDVCKSFDNRLNNVLAKRVETAKMCYREEFTVVSLLQSVLETEEMETVSTLFVDVLAQLDAECLKVRKEHTNFKVVIETEVHKEREIVDAVLNVERGFKRDFLDAGEHLDELYKIFKAKGKGKRNLLKATNIETLLHPNTPERKVKKSKKSRKSMDNALLMGHPQDTAFVYEPMSFADLPSVSPEVLVRFNERRRRKAELEFDLNKKRQHLQILRVQYQQMAQKSEKMERSYADVKQAQEDFAVKCADIRLNTELMFKYSQGKVEIDEGPVASDLNNCIVIDRSLIEDLNSHITNLATAHTGVMRTMTEFRHGIRLLQWEKQRVKLKLNEAADETRTMMLLRVTKNLQAIIKVGGHDSKSQQELNVLDRKLQHMKQLTAEDLLIRRRKFKTIKNQIAHQKIENVKLEQARDRLARLVDERQQITKVRLDSEDRVQQIAEKMQLASERRKVLDIIEQQRGDLILLSKERDKIRMSTFPSFPQPYSARMLTHKAPARDNRGLYRPSPRTQVQRTAKQFPLTARYSNKRDSRYGGSRGGSSSSRKSSSRKGNLSSRQSAEHVTGWSNGDAAGQNAPPAGGLLPQIKLNTMMRS